MNFNMLGSNNSNAGRTSFCPACGAKVPSDAAFCPDCGKKIQVFGKSHIEEVAAQFELPVLAQLPIDPKVAEAFDNGLMETVDTSAVAGVIEAIKKAE